MNGGWALLSGGTAAAFAAAMAIRESRWRALVARELPPEISFGVLAPEDVEILGSWRRYRKGWEGSARERRTVRRIAGRLARAKVLQRTASSSRQKILQVQILTLRTRLRQARSGRASARVGGPPWSDGATHLD